MVSQKSVDQQMKRLGKSFTFFGRAEVKELPSILFPNEIILSCLMGFYGGGTAMMLATNRRLLIVDKKLWFLSLEELRYDMITDVEFRVRIFQAETVIRSIGKELTFSTWNTPALRKLTQHVQEKLMELREMMMQPQRIEIHDRPQHSSFPQTQYYQTDPDPADQPHVAHASESRPPAAPPPMTWPGQKPAAAQAGEAGTSAAHHPGISVSSYGTLSGTQAQRTRSYSVSRILLRPRLGKFTLKTIR